MNTLSVVHVAGTKGKVSRPWLLTSLLRHAADAPLPQGSTCAFAESILRRCGQRTGLFTSPHLVDVRERIQINGCGLARPESCRNCADVAHPAADAL